MISFSISTARKNRSRRLSARAKPKAAATRCRNPVEWRDVGEEQLQHDDRADEGDRVPCIGEASATGRSNSGC